MYKSTIADIFSCAILLCYTIVIYCQCLGMEVFIHINNKEVKEMEEVSRDGSVTATEYNNEELQ